MRTVDVTDPHADEQRERLAALLMTVAGWPNNYTATLDIAKWLIAEAERVGWELSVVTPILPGSQEYFASQRRGGR